MGKTQSQLHSQPQSQPQPLGPSKRSNENQTHLNVNNVVNNNKTTMTKPQSPYTNTSISTSSSCHMNSSSTNNNPLSPSYIHVNGGHHNSLNQSHHHPAARKRLSSTGSMGSTSSHGSTGSIPSVNSSHNKATSNTTNFLLPSKRDNHSKMTKQSQSSLHISTPRSTSTVSNAFDDDPFQSNHSHHHNNHNNNKENTRNALQPFGVSDFGTGTDHNNDNMDGPSRAPVPGLVAEDAFASSSSLGSSSTDFFAAGFENDTKITAPSNGNTRDDWASNDIFSDFSVPSFEKHNNSAKMKISPNIVIANKPSPSTSPDPFDSCAFDYFGGGQDPFAVANHGYSLGAGTTSASAAIGKDDFSWRVPDESTTSHHLQTMFAATSTATASASVVQELVLESSHGPCLAPEAVAALRGLLIGCDYYRASQYAPALDAFQETVDQFAHSQVNRRHEEDQADDDEETNHSNTTTFSFLARVASSCLVGVGDCLQKQHLYQDALSSYKQVISVTSTCLGHQYTNQDVAQAHFQMGLIYSSTQSSTCHCPKDAVACFHRAILAYRQCSTTAATNDDVMLGCVYHNLGNALRQAGCAHDQALEAYQDAITVFTNTDADTGNSKTLFHSHTATSLNAMACVYFDICDYPKAATAHGKAMQILSHRVAATQEMLVACNGNGNGNNSHTAAAYYQDELMRDRVRMARTLHWLGRTHLQQGTAASIQTSLKAYRASLRLIHTACGAFHPWMAATHEKMGHLVERTMTQGGGGDYQHALASYKEAWMMLHLHHRTNPRAAPSLLRLLHSIARVEQELLE
jgi:tetratricopeptide (TPR) repeat protein